MNIERTALSGAVILTPARFGDARGWFSETWNKNTLAAHDIDVDFVQDNQSYSAQNSTLRGLHYQSPPFAQDKLVRCTRGRLLDVAVDVRVGSPSFGKSISVELSAENGRQLLVPIGFLHGFVTLELDTEVQYKCSNFYNSACDGAVHWDSCGVDWSLTGEPELSEKDRTAPNFSNWKSPFIYSELR